MPQTINHPTLGAIEFPDEMGDEQIVAAIQKLESGAAQEAPAAPPPPPAEQPAKPTVDDALSQVSATWGQGEDASSPNMVRYGVPMAVGRALAPYTRGMSVPAAAAVEAAGGLISSPTGEAIAQFLEGDGLDAKAIRSAAILGGTPFIGGASPLLARVTVNPVLSVATGELNRFLEQGDLKNREGESSLMRWGVEIGAPSALSFIGKQGRKLDDAAELKAYTLADRRGGTMLLSELFKDFSDLERNQISKGNKIALNLLDNMDVGVTDLVKQAYPDVPETSQLATKLYENVGQLRKLRSDVVDAQRAADQANREYREMLAINPAEAKALSERANKSALEATTKQLLERGVRERLFNGIPDITSTASGIRNELLKQSIGSAKGSVKVGIGKLFDAAGFGPNTPIVAVEDVVQQLKKQAVRGGPLEGNKAYARAEKILLGAFPKGRSTLTTEEFREVRDEVARGLTKDGYDPKVANRVAGGMYNVVSEAADSFIARTAPDRIAAWKAAKTIAAKNFQALDSGAIALLEDGKADELYNFIKKEGNAGKTIADLNYYADVVKEVAGDNAANVLRQNINSSIRDSILDVATKAGKESGFDREWRVIDSGALVKELQYLKSQGFPVDSLGLGNAKDISTLARLAAKQGTPGYTVDELVRVLEDAKAIGVEPAAAKHLYFKEVRDQLIAKGRASGNKNAKLVRASRNANLDLNLAKQAEDAAKSDPLVVFLNDTNMKLSKDVAANRDWVMRLSTQVDPETARRFMDSLENSGRTEAATAIRVAAGAEMARQFVQTDLGERLAVEKLYKQFFDSSGKRSKAAESFRAVLGEEYFNEFNNNVLNNVASIYKGRQGVSALGDSPSQLARNARFAVPPVAGLRAYTSVQALVDMVNQGRYNLAYKMYLDPKTAPMFAKAGYNLDKFVASNPTNALVLRLAALEDGQNTPSSEKSP